MASSKEEVRRSDVVFCIRVAAKLFLESAEERVVDNNLVISPLSLNLVLNMLAAGANGSTLDQLLKFLELDSINEANSQSSRMLALVSPSGADTDGPMLSFTNGLWVDQWFSLKPSFQQICQDVYDMKPQVVDFVKQGEKVREEVNLWAEKVTKGLIKDLLPPNYFKPLTVLAIANALYFKGEWCSPFDKEATREKTFHLLNGEKVKAPFMIETNCWRQYYESVDDDFKVLKLPYEHRKNRDGTRFSMYIFLPNKRDGLIQVLQKLNSNPRILLSVEDSQFVALSTLCIPKLKFSYSFQAEEVMTRLGLILPFDEVEANFTGMGSRLGDPPFVSSILQKSFIEVDEKGTEAAAVTLLSDDDMGFSLEDEPPRPSFIAKHPFIFMIKEEVSGFVFFLGTVLNPLSDNHP